MVLACAGTVPSWYTLGNNQVEMIENRLKSKIKKHNWDQWKTGNELRARAKRCLAILGDIPDHRWDQDVLVDVLKSRGLQPSTINRYLATMDSLDYPVNYLNVPKAEQRVLSEIELETLDDNVRAVDGWDDYKAFYGFLRDTGCRGIEEFNRLDWNEVDWGGRSCLLTAFKGKHVNRTVPLTDIALNSLKWLAHVDYDLDRDAWYRFWRMVRLDPDNKPYDLRHTFCTRLLDAGVAPQTVMHIMGHSDLRMTMEYYHLRPSTLAEAARLLQ